MALKFVERSALLGRPLGVSVGLSRLAASHTPAANSCFEYGRGYFALVMGTGSSRVRNQQDQQLPQQQQYPGQQGVQNPSGYPQAYPPPPVYRQQVTSLLLPSLLQRLSLKLQRAQVHRHKKGCMRVCVLGQCRGPSNFLLRTMARQCNYLATSHSFSQCHIRRYVSMTELATPCREQNQQATGIRQHRLLLCRHGKYTARGGITSMSF